MDPGRDGDLVHDAIGRIREITDEGRRVASWIEEFPDDLYLPEWAWGFRQDSDLPVQYAAQLAGISTRNLNNAQSTLWASGLRVGDGITPRKINSVLRKFLPKNFPWVDENSTVKYSDALFCMNRSLLHTRKATGPCMVWAPGPNEFNLDLYTREGAAARDSIFDRHGFNDDRSEPIRVTSHQFRRLANTIAERGGLSQEEIARWSGRADIKQNRFYDHMSEFELVDLLREHDSSLTLDRGLQEISKRISELMPMTSKEFNSTIFPTAHITEYGFCVHDYVMSPCQRFRDCLNCSEQVCVKGDPRVSRIEDRLSAVQELRARAEVDVEKGEYGAERWLEVHRASEARMKELIEILRSESVPDGAIVKLRNDSESSAWRRAVDRKHASNGISATDRELLMGLNTLGEDRTGEV